MPPTTRKTPAEAAAAEAGTDILQVPFRGEKFPIDRAVFASARFWMMYKQALDPDLQTVGVHDVLYEVLGGVNAGLFVQVARRGESMVDAMNEFFEAINAAGGSGKAAGSRSARRSSNTTKS